MRNRDKENKQGIEKKELPKAALTRILALVALTTILVVIYRFFLNTPYFLIVFGGYMAILTILVVVYVLYNRGMSRKGITEDMLPDNWSQEEKQRFIDDGKRRLERSKWMLVLIFALVVVLIIDAVELFVLPALGGLFSWPV